ncbi:MAG: transposase [Gammaproteobacteria bacterium]|nr:transposase [Gammaproteobacteria bacterium]
MGRSRYQFTDNKLPHFVTLTVLHWIPAFTQPATVNILLDSLRFLQNETLKLYAFVILENHIHRVAQSQNLQKDMMRFKSHTARKLIPYFQKNHIRTILDQLMFYKKAHKTDRNYQFWQEGVHPEWIQNNKMLEQKVEYIHNNPVKRGYVDLPEHWRYSSARNYQGETGLIQVCKEW